MMSAGTQKQQSRSLCLNKRVALYPKVVSLSNQLPTQEPRGVKCPRLPRPQPVILMLDPSAIDDWHVLGVVDFAK